MKKQMYTIGAIALTLAMSGLPALALAESGNGEGQGRAMVGAQVKAQVTAQAQAQEEGVPMGVSARVGDKDVASSSEAVRKHAPFGLEGTTTLALSFGQLKQSIELRKQELDQEEASSSPETQGLMKNTNPVRLAVHALLASKDLLGGIGQQVSVIAQQMNDSVATTTSAEAQIQSRGFFAKLFFGGDITAADVIKQQVVQNQQRIDNLTKLLGQADISAEVKVELQAQITKMQEAQVKLQTLAQKEQGMWGLFSWRF